MKSSLRNLFLAAMTAALPMVVTAQSGTSGGSGSSAGAASGTGSSTGQTGSSSQMPRSGTQTGGAAGSPHAGTSGSYGSTGSSASSGSMSISRIDKNSVDQQFTATDLIGKEVYDNAGKKVGEVKDVVLGSAGGSHLAMAFASSDIKSGASGSAGSLDASARSTRENTTAGRTTATGTGSGLAGTGTSGAAGASGLGGTSADRSSTSGGSWSSQAQGALSSLSSEPAAILSVGGFMGVGDNMVRVPLSQLNYDSSNQHLMLAVSQSELSSLADISNTGRNAAE